MGSSNLIIFARPLVHGKVKNRLAAQVGHKKALEVYEKLFNHTMNVAVESKFPFTIYYSDPFNHRDPDSKVQLGRDIGERMANALELELTNQKKDKICLIGSDCLEITAEIISDAFTQLEHFDVVLGPAKDGGYYLIGLKQPNATLFESIDWSTSKVLAQTLRKAQALGLSVHLLPELADVDTASDLPSGW